MARSSLVVLIAGLVATSLGAQQQLGTKIMGGLGIDAGTQGPPGLYIIDRFLEFRSDKARDRNGNVLPIAGLDILVRGNALGAAYTVALPTGPLLTFGASLPWARVSVNSDEPLVSIDRLGVGDIFVQPFKIGAKQERYDVVAAYALFAPTGKFEPKSGIGAGRGHWTHQFSVGGAAYARANRARRASALLSYEINGKKRGIELWRGSILHIQGGAGTPIYQGIVLGVAGYGLRQVSDDRGAALPPRIKGARTRAYGLGPEVDFVIPQFRLRGDIRYEWDFGVRARPQGRVLAVGLAYRAWGPSTRR
ncbi:MAG TPA: transporter [Gemmatimonadaceae bacterium]|nr:transporter [Gemmatimonadaceae bacterium]